jgi:hypothetical protein
MRCFVPVDVLLLTGATSEASVEDSEFIRILFLIW